MEMIVTEMRKMKPEHKKEYESLFKSIQYGELIYAMSILSDLMEVLKYAKYYKYNDTPYWSAQMTLADIQEHIKDVKELVMIHAQKQETGIKNNHLEKDSGKTSVGKGRGHKN
jgi:hypothetical protein